MSRFKVPENLYMQLDGLEGQYITFPNALKVIRQQHKSYTKSSLYNRASQLSRDGKTAKLKTVLHTPNIGGAPRRFIERRSFEELLKSETLGSKSPKAKRSKND